jgi:hypothetical protein
MKTRLAIPDITRGVTDDGQPALLLSIGAASRRWPALISPADFDLVTRTTGHRAWGVQGRNVVVGDLSRSCGRRAVTKIIAGITGTKLRPVYRDGNPLNLMRSNIGIQGTGGIFWLELRPGEVDPIHYNGAFPNHTPQSLSHHRTAVRPPIDPAQSSLASQDRHWTQR